MSQSGASVSGFAIHTLNSCLEQVSGKHSPQLSQSQSNPNCSGPNLLGQTTHRLTDFNTFYIHTADACEKNLLWGHTVNQQRVTDKVVID